MAKPPYAPLMGSTSGAPFDLSSSSSVPLSGPTSPMGFYEPAPGETLNLTAPPEVPSENAPPPGLPPAQRISPLSTVLLDNLRKIADAIAKAGSPRQKAMLQEKYDNTLLLLSRLSQQTPDGANAPDKILQEASAMGLEMGDVGSNAPTAEGSSRMVTALLGSESGGLTKTPQGSIVNVPKEGVTSALDRLSLSRNASGRVGEAEGPLAKAGAIATGAADVAAGTLFHGLESFQRAANMPFQVTAATIAPETFTMPDVFAPVGTPNQTGIALLKDPEKHPITTNLLEVVDPFMLAGGIGAGAKALGKTADIVTATKIPMRGITSQEMTQIYGRMKKNTAEAFLKGLTLMGDTRQALLPLRSAKKGATSITAGSETLASTPSMVDKIYEKLKFKKGEAPSALDPKNPDFQDFALEQIAVSRADGIKEVGKGGKYHRGLHSNFTKFLGEVMPLVFSGKGVTFKSQLNYLKTREDVTDGLASQPGVIDPDFFYEALLGGAAMGDVGAVRSTGSRIARQQSTEVARTQAAVSRARTKAESYNDKLDDGLDKLEQRMDDLETQIAQRQQTYLDQASLQAKREGKAQSAGREQHRAADFKVASNELFTIPLQRKYTEDIFATAIEKGYISKAKADDYLARLSQTADPGQLSAIADEFALELRGAPVGPGKIKGANGTVIEVPVEEMAARRDIFAEKVERALLRINKLVSGAGNANITHTTVGQNAIERELGTTVALDQGRMDLSRASFRIQQMKDNLTHLGGKHYTMKGSFKDIDAEGVLAEQSQWSHMAQAKVKELDDLIKQAMQPAGGPPLISAQRAKVIREAMSHFTKAPQTLDELDALIALLRRASPPNGAYSSAADEVIQNMAQSLRELRDDAIMAAIRKKHDFGGDIDEAAVTADWQRYSEAKAARDGLLDTRVKLASHYMPNKFNVVNRDMDESTLLQTIGSDVNMATSPQVTSGITPTSNLANFNTVLNDVLLPGGVETVPDFTIKLIDAAHLGVRNTQRGRVNPVVSPNTAGTGAPTRLDFGESGTILPSGHPYLPSNSYYGTSGENGSQSFLDKVLSTAGKAALGASNGVGLATVMSMAGMDPLTMGVLTARALYTRPTVRALRPVATDAAQAGVKSARWFKPETIELAFRESLGRILYGGGSPLKNPERLLAARAAGNTAGNMGNDIANETLYGDKPGEEITDEMLMEALRQVPAYEIKHLIPRVIEDMIALSPMLAAKDVYDYFASGFDPSWTLHRGSDLPAERRKGPDGKPLYTRGGPAKMASDLIDSGVKNFAGVAQDLESGVQQLVAQSPSIEAALKTWRGSEGAGIDSSDGTKVIHGLRESTFNKIGEAYRAKGLKHPLYTELKAGSKEVLDYMNANPLSTSYDILSFHLSDRWKISPQDLDAIEPTTAGLLGRLVPRESPVLENNWWKSALVTSDVGEALREAYPETFGVWLDPSKATGNILKGGKNSGIYQALQAIAAMEDPEEKAQITKLVNDRLLAAYREYLVSKNAPLNEIDSLRKLVGLE